MTGPRLAHLADLHLGFRQFARHTTGGLNVRELDVATAFTRAVDGIVQAQPDLIVVAGDVFHAPRPPNNAIAHALRQFARLRRVAPVLVVAGNHDTPRSVDTGHVLPALEAVGVDVVLQGPQRRRVGDLACWCVPDTGVPTPVTWEPDPGATWNVAVVHGEVRGAVGGGPGKLTDWPADTWGPAWHYVALGHYHQQQQVGPRAWYAGALESTSSDPWREIGAPPRGWLLVTLGDAPTVVPQPIGGTRRFVDPPATHLAPGDPDAMVAAIDAALDAEGDLRGAVVRVRLVAGDRAAARTARAYARQRARARGAFHLQWDVRVEEAVVVEAGRPRRVDLATRLAGVLTARAEASGVPLATLQARATQYLAEADERLAATAGGRAAAAGTSSPDA